MLHPHERITDSGEEKVRKAHLSSLRIMPRLTARPVVIALVGAVGSGKSAIAKLLAHEIGGTIIENDAIRTKLREKDLSFKNVRLIGEDAMEYVVEKGGNVVLDSDHIDKAKRASVRTKAHKAGARFLLVRTCADLDTMIGRMQNASYVNGSFFAGAATEWKGTVRERAAVVKIREFVRRMLHHYRWENRDGGRLTLKKLPFKVAATFDTTDPDLEMRVKVFAQYL